MTDRHSAPTPTDVGPAWAHEVGISAVLRAAVVPGPCARADAARAATGRRIGRPFQDLGPTSGRRASGPLCGPVTAGGFRADVRAHGPTADGSGPHAGPGSWSPDAVGLGDMSERPFDRTHVRPNKCSGRRPGGPARKPTLKSQCTQIPMHPEIHTKFETQSQIPMRPELEAGSGLACSNPNAHLGVDFSSRMDYRYRVGKMIKEGSR